MRRPLLLLLLLGVIPCTLALNQNISACGEYPNASTTYLLTQDLDNTSGSAVDTSSFGWNPACLFFSNATNVTLDCQGHTITRDDPMTILMGGDNLGANSLMTIKNCHIIADASTEIVELSEAGGGQIGNYLVENNTIIEPTLSSSAIGTFDNVAGGVGTVRNNNITAPSAGNVLDIEDNKVVTISSNSINTSGFYFQNSFSTTVKFDNGTRGNYYLRPNGSGFSETCTDANTNGICDSTYVVAAASGPSLTDHHALKYGFVGVIVDDVVPSSPNEQFNRTAANITGLAFLIVLISGFLFEFFFFAVTGNVEKNIARFLAVIVALSIVLLALFVVL